MDVLQRFGRRVRELRAARGWSQEGFALECGLHRTYVSGVERGERNISLVNIEKLAVTLGVPISDLFPAARRVASRRTSKKSGGRRSA